MLWERYPQYHEMTTFSTLDDLLQEHESWQKDFENLRDEFISNRYNKFFVKLSWEDLAYRSIDFFGGEEALAQRQELDRQKRQLCEENHVRLIEWAYTIEPTDRNIQTMLCHDKMFA